MSVGILVFPGSNCDRDVRWATEGCLGIPTKFIWHETTDLSGFDAIVLPGGFSYGDYLRCGAIARFAPALTTLIKFVNDGGKVLGICNGFQILTELGLLPGALIRNKELNFVCKNIDLSIESQRTNWFSKYQSQQNIKLPIAHGEGCFYCDEDTLKKIQDTDSIALKYHSNPNGSTFGIAGITNKKGNVLGMMPHPERACDQVLGNLDGRKILESLIG
tara:strand:+ start:22 stop:675 length:654 start_codon:yes stop_codon:yes gene_type:complete